VSDSVSSSESESAENALLVSSTVILFLLGEFCWFCNCRFREVVAVSGLNLGVDLVRVIRVEVLVNVFSCWLLVLGRVVVF
jgi:hypothetical protein